MANSKWQMVNGKTFSDLTPLLFPLILRGKTKGFKLFCIVTYLLFTVFSLFSVLAYAASYQDWLKNIGKQKIRKVHSKHTALAAVRGVDEPGQVDKNARNYEAVHQMEQKTISQEKLIRFIQEGKLVLYGGDSFGR